MIFGSIAGFPLFQSTLRVEVAERNLGCAAGPRMEEIKVPESPLAFMKSH
jgi:hypothetical protein